MSFIKPRPLVRWHGGKWVIAPWIIKQMPPHRIYVEPFGGGASVLLRKPRSYAEIYNDLDAEIVNLFTVARDRGEQLRRVTRLTPYSRREYERSYEPCRKNPGAARRVEIARRTLVKSFMGFGSLSPARRITGFRANVSRSGSLPVHDWANFPDALDMAIDRLRGVVIECRPAIVVMRQYDSPDALHYVDPPYAPETRDAGSDYKHELTAKDHAELFRFLRTLRGAVMVSAYPCLLYDGLYGGCPGWRHVTRSALANGGLKRTEVLWMRGPRRGL